MGGGWFGVLSKRKRRVRSRECEEKEKEERREKREKGGRGGQIKKSRSAHPFFARQWACRVDGDHTCCTWTSLPPSIPPLLLPLTAPAQNVNRIRNLFSKEGANDFNPRHPPAIHCEG